MSSDFAMSTSAITQTIKGDRNIFAGTGNVTVIYNLPQADAEDRRGLLILLDRVKQFWVEGVLEQSVQHEALINLGMEARVDAVEHPWEQLPGVTFRSALLELPNAATQRLAPDTKITDVFESVARLLLILGEPGSGKTITLLELARDLVARASSDPGQPVPVVFNLSSWTEEFTSLADWLTEELKTRYRIRKYDGRSWLEANRLMLLLDGLDEVQVRRRAACIRAINAFLDQGTAGLVVCSRLAEYAAEPVRLKMNGAICLRPLTATQIETYLSRLGSRLDALRAALNKDDVLRDLAKSPLMLSVMTLAYQGPSVGDLGETIETPEARRKQIFATYVARMFARRGRAAGSAYAQEQTYSWLSWLAQNMQRHGQSIFLIEQMQPSWLDNIRQIFMYIFSARVAAVAAIWAALCLSAVVLVLTFGTTDYTPDYRSFIESDLHSIYSSSNLLLGAKLLGSHILTLFLGTICSCSIDLSRYHIEKHLSTPRILRNGINNPFLVILANMLSWAAVATVIHTLFVFPREMVEIAGYTFGVVWGLIFGMLSCKRSVSRDIRIHDRLMWSWAGPMIISIPAFIVIAFYYVTILLGSRVQIVTYTAKTVMALTGSFYFVGSVIILFHVLWPPLLVLLGLRTGVREVKEGANYGITSGLVNAYRAGLVMFASGMLGFCLTAFLFLSGDDRASFIAAGAAIYVMAGTGFALAFGGIDFINHFVLRLIVYRNGYTPRKLHVFLDHCTKLVFLRRVGGGYIFIHRLLLEHFAAMWEAEHKQKGAPLH